MDRREFLRTALVSPAVASSALNFSFARADEPEKKPVPKRAKTPGAGLNPRFIGARCLRCKKVYPLSLAIADRGTGCPECLAQGYPVNVTFHYESVGKNAFAGSGSKMERYRELLPLLDFPVLGEGDTPLLPLKPLARKLGLGELYAKDESRAPTGSHKDRMSGLAVARAAQLKRPGIVAASSGNGGHSIAAYAGAAGLPCTILSTKKLSAPWKQAVLSTGATLKIVETSEERWEVMKVMVEKEGWYPATNFLSPPVGSNPFSVQGLKTIAYEIAKDLGHGTVDAIVVPTCRGDLLWGIYEGFAEMVEAGIIRELPRLFAVEPFPRLERILEGQDYRTKFTQPDHPMVSIGGSTSAFQALSAVKLSKGGACSVTTQNALRARDELSSHGLYLELSSAAALAGLYTLVEKKTILPGQRVVLVSTSHGYKQI